MKSKAGFTLIEILVALAITAIIMGSVYSAFLSQQKSTVVQTNVSDIQQNLRAAMDFLARDIRLAGYAGPDLGSIGNFGFTDVGFKNYDLSPNADGSGYVQFSWDMNDNDLVGADETVSYSLANDSDAAPGSIALMRELGSGGRQAMAGYVINFGLAFSYDADQDGEVDRDAAGNVIWAVDTDNDGDWDNLDRNSDGQITAADLSSGTTGVIGGTDTGTPLKYRDIRAVRIWLLGRSQAPDNTFTDNNVYVVGRDVIQPNDNYRHRLLERTVLCRNMGLKK
jgi:prepilin-type N-terminal cleavage/methylation domain-containing protein